MSTQSEIITSKNLVAGYPDNIVWRDASFTIDRGEFVAVIGPNGAGKTTLFRLLLGLQQPVSGTIKIFNAAPKRGNPQIGYVPQRHIIDRETNVESLELVRLGISGKQWGLGLYSQNDRKAALDVLEAVGATDLAHRSLGVLSGGELQRIFLAEALVSNPAVLLLDEPLSNLDMRREKELVQLISGVVRSRNVTALLIAHNINPLLPFLDKVVYIANGKVATGTPQEVLTSECLTALFGVHVEVLRDSKGNIAVIGIEDVHGDQ
ncbi:MAG: ABC transporter ATP-binding protein [Nitrososphaeria archaeon]|jgi:zinc/manganese transport system ATP-binding protein